MFERLVGSWNEKWRRCFDCHIIMVSDCQVEAFSWNFVGLNGDLWAPGAITGLPRTSKSFER